MAIILRIILFLVMAFVLVAASAVLLQILPVGEPTAVHHNAEPYWTVVCEDYVENNWIPRTTAYGFYSLGDAMYLEHLKVDIGVTCTYSTFLVQEPNFTSLFVSVR